MAGVADCPGKAMVVAINGTVLKSSTYNRQRQGGELPLPTSGLVPDGDGNYEVPHDVGMVVTTIKLTSIFDQNAPYHAAPYNLRTGVTVTLSIGMTAALLTPAVSYKVMDTTDSNDAEKTGLWECTLKPATDSSPGYYS